MGTGDVNGQASQVLAFINTVEMAAQMILRGFDAGGGQIDVPVDPPDAKITELLSLRQAIGELEPRDRSIIIFRYFQSRTQVQTAQALGMTQVQVSRREKAILQRMREKLSQG